MNELLTISQKNASTLTMSSREIADICGKRHELVMRDIAILNESYQKMGYPIILETLYTHPQNGQVYKHCLLNRDQVLDLVTGYKHEIRIKINRRWVELESRQKPVALIPQSFSEALMLAAQLQAEKEQNAPKVEAFDRLATATEGAMNLTNAAKHLQMQPRAFNQFLFANGWIYKRTIGSAWIAYQDKLQRGYLEHKAHPVTQSDGTEKIYPQVLVTAKGLAKLSTMLNKEAA